MLNKKAKKTTILIILSMTLFSLSIITYDKKTLYRNNINYNQNKKINQVFKSINLRYSGYIVENPIFIDGDATGVGAHNWTWAEDQDWCRGTGTWNDPYIIENLFIDGNDLSSCIEIHNSAKFLLIRNCTIFNSTSSGINFENVHNSTISDNYCTNNTNGIFLWECRNNTISGNIANNNTDVGIFLSQCDNNTIYNNTANYNNGSSHSNMGILLYGCDFNIVSENTADNNKYGIFVSSNYPTIWGGCHNNTIINNTVSYNDGGIKLYGMGRTYNNTIIGNYVSKNLEYGIELSKSPQNMISNNIIKDNEKDGIYLTFQSHNNTISDNIIENNNQQGIKIDFESHGNLLYYNYFVGNGIYAQDNGTYNRWDNGIIGNYWDDYDGVDANDDGIGDTPYIISGTAGSQDNFPIWADGDDIAPVITIILPLPDSVFGLAAPNYNISIVELNLDTIWYTLNGGITNYTTTGLTGTFNHLAWEALSEGSLTIRFYANDTAGNISFTDVEVIIEIPEDLDGLPIISFGNYYILFTFITILSFIILEKRKKK